MAHFAQIDQNGIVLLVVAIADSKLMENGEEVEQKGIDFLKPLLKENYELVRTSETGAFRKNFAGIGFTYDRERDAFIPPKPEYALNEKTCQWELLNGS